METKFAAYITKDKYSYDINSEYLLDPKISTYVILPAGAKLTVISPDTIRRVYVISNGLLNATSGQEEIVPLTYETFGKEYYALSFKFDGIANKIEFVGSSDEDIKIYFITMSYVEISRVFLESTDKSYIPKNSTIKIGVGAGYPEGSIIKTEILPSNGYALNISYMSIMVPDGIGVMLYFETAKGISQMVESEIQGYTEYVIDASDYGGLFMSHISDVIIQIHVAVSLEHNVYVVVKYAGVEESL